MEILVKILQLILSLSILVILHELGHFIPSKLFKVRVEKFYLFFDPWFSLFKIKRGHTEYGVGWLPLGGYVKISGMIDESMDKEQMKQPPQPWEFRSKPSWQRLIIMLGGVSVNILLAIAIYIVMLTVWGETYLPTSEVKYGITADSLAKEMGLQNGDKILSVDYVEVEDFFKIPSIIILDKAKSVQVLRNNENINIDIPKEFVGKLIKHNSPDFIGARMPFKIKRFTKKSEAKKSGLKNNDFLIGINDVSTVYYDEFVKEIKKHKKQNVEISALRGKDTVIVNVDVSDKGLIGVEAEVKEFFKFKERSYTFAQAIPAGAIKAYKTLGNYLKQLKLIFSPETKAYQSLGGFITIGNIFPGVWDWQSFWNLTAFLSIILAIMNVLPIPALDGGHVMFLLYEMITGRKPGDKFMEYAQIVGMVILLSLLVFANGNDIVKLFK
ncbi:MAG: RIP metalloprotease RseP [Saprospiraceae bacterium]|nr:RIP metalloprotease RseP [Saprospiraceae bacterium]